MFESNIMLLHYRASAGFSLRSSTLAKYRKVLWRFVMAPFHYFFTKLCSYNSTKLVTAQITFQHNRCTFNICGTLKVRHPQPLPDFPKWRRQHQSAVKRSHSRRRCHKSHLPKTPSKATTQHLRAERCTDLQRCLVHIPGLVEVEVQPRQQRRVETWRDAVMVVPAALMAVAVIIAVVQILLWWGVVPVR